MNWDWLKSKFFWINAIVIIVFVLNYLITNNLWPEYVDYFNLVIGVLGLISNMIAGTATSLRLAKANKQVIALQSKLNNRG